ncbi:hypothetical protein QYE76_030050 [Lolium multiflorum]|uniref:Uncharacterized protein n=1 Tax=Lolium multiflorum TaxID=4521 RepID=A0AAD8VG47_LOLMU|nr:hypothetical protein QYE76_030050 [Lolium multiflorum]
MHPRGGGDRAAVRKGPWTAEEDEVLRQHVREHGPREWSSIRSKGLLPRTGKSCRLRWVNKLRPNLKTGCKFSAEEERVVIELQAQFGNKWARISTYLPGRTDNDVKNFWSTRQKRLARMLRAPLSRRRPAAARHSATGGTGGAPSSSPAASRDQLLRAPEPEPLRQDQVPCFGTMIPFQETPMNQHHIGESSQEPPPTAVGSPFHGLLGHGSILPSPIGFAAAGCSSSYGAAPEAHHPLSFLYAGDPALMVDAAGFVDSSALIHGGGVAYLEPKRELEEQQPPAGFFGLGEDDDDVYGHIVSARRGAPDVRFDDLAPEMFDFFELPPSPPSSPPTRP